METKSGPEDVLKFLNYAKDKKILNANTVGGRITACTNVFSFLDERERSVEFVRDNLELIRNRMNNAINSNGASGETIDIYINRAKLALEDYFAWREDAGQWERVISGKSKTRKKDGQKDKSVKKIFRNGSASEELVDSNTIDVRFPLRKDFDFTGKIPRDMTMDELKKLGLFLISHCQDLTPHNIPSWPIEHKGSD